MKLFVSDQFLLTMSLTGQVQHPPTAAQCRAHQRLWLSKVEAGYDANADYLPGWETISQWQAKWKNARQPTLTTTVPTTILRAEILAFKSMRDSYTSSFVTTFTTSSLRKTKQGIDPTDEQAKTGHSRSFR